MKVQILLLILGLASVTFASVSKISPSVWKHISRSTSVNILISFHQSDLDSIRDSVSAQSFANRTQRIQTLYNSLKSHADLVQAQVLRALEASKSRTTSVQVNQLWITNQIAVKRADLSLLQELDQFPEILSIEKEEFVPLAQPVETTIVPKEQILDDEQWGVLAVEAPEVWKSGNRGAGAVIAVVDTGVLGTHEALRDGYRQLNGWYDPIAKSDSPNDENGHGTHIAGTIVGRVNGIGVAPEAQWIACKGCGWISCSSSDILACGQWALCPTDSRGSDPRCDLAPSAITNGWGGSGGNFYEEVLKTLEAAGIASIFAAGVSGPMCGNVGPPGDSLRAIAVASLSQDNRVSSFSGAGPTPAGDIKPDLCAPGSGVLSASASSDDAYATMSGTSMAVPHVSGVIALLKSKKPDASLTEIKEALFKGAQPTVPTGRNCGGIDENIYPNNVAGYGSVNARASVAQLS